jgi:hypothetical protein
MSHTECNEVSALASARPSTCADQKAKDSAMKFMDAASEFKALTMFDDLTIEADDFSLDSDCSFYEIESHLPLMLHLDVEITEKEASSILCNLDESIFQPLFHWHGSTPIQSMDRVKEPSSSLMQHGYI